MKDNIVTIDGPSASGKGTLARNIAKYLGFEILDSGLLYRVYAYLYDCGIEHSQITKTINQDITFKSDESGIVVLKEKNNITYELRKESTAKAASRISALPETRENLMLLQRGFYLTK
jgi:cytidylate kinase